MIGLKLFLPAAGYREDSDGWLSGRGTIGFYWSSSMRNGATDIEYLNVANNVIFTHYYGARLRGASIRCMSE
jgi:hypothetical protein